MTEKTVTIGDEEVQIIETDDGFEATVVEDEPDALIRIGDGFGTDGYYVEVPLTSLGDVEFHVYSSDNRLSFYAEIAFDADDVHDFGWTRSSSQSDIGDGFEHYINVSTFELFFDGSVEQRVDMEDDDGDVVLDFRSEPDDDNYGVTVRIGEDIGVEAFGGSEDLTVTWSEDMVVVDEKGWSRGDGLGAHVQYPDLYRVDEGTFGSDTVDISEIDEDVMEFRISGDVVQLPVSADFEMKVDDHGDAYVAYHDADNVHEDGYGSPPTGLTTTTLMGDDVYTMYFEDVELIERDD